MYDIGDKVRLKATFEQDDSGVDPDTVTLKVKAPDGTITTVTDGSMTHTTTGVYSYDVDVDQVGMWHFKFTSTGAYQAAGEGTFRVRPSEFD